MSDANELVEAITCGGRRRHWADGEKLRIVVTRCAATIHLAHRVALIRAYSRAQRRLDIRPIPSKIYEAIRHDSPGFTRGRYSLHKPVRLLRKGEQGYVKCPHEGCRPLAFANCVKLRIRGNAWERAGVVGDSPWLIRELEDESFPSASWSS